MKNSRTSAQAFTLVELLTVIAIIAILMGLLFPVIGSVKDKARGVEAKNVLTELASAVQNYYRYGKYPVVIAPGVATDFFAGNGSTDSNEINLIKVLRAATVDGSAASADADITTLNPRLISYLDLPSAKTPDKDKAYSGLDTDGNMHDPWGGIYRCLIDSNYDNSIDNPYTKDSGAGSQKLTKGAIFWCLGKDGDGAKTGTAAQGSKTVAPYLDDIISWQ